jgi:diguanylate cyclase (GGDEF)-like protein/PAS domain S-box-containing protein
MEMKVAAETIARGHYGFRLTVRSQDELGELASVLNKMAHQIELKQATEDRLHTLVENMVGLTGQEYLDMATCELVRWFDADGANIGEVMKDDQIRTLSMYLDGKKVHDFKYVREDTPYHNAIAPDTCLYSSDVCKRFPDAKLLKKLGIQGYAGAPISNQKANMIGVVWVVSRNPLQVPPQWKDVLNIISAKTGAEIERMRAEQALSLSLEKYRALVEATQDFVWEIDQRGVYTYCSPQTKAILGYAPKEMLGKTPFDFMTTSEASRISLQFKKFLDQEAAFLVLENINLHEDGHEVILETSGLPFFDTAGKLVGYRGIDRDITERRAAEANLRKSEERFRKLIDGLPKLAVQGYNKNRQVIYWNQASTRLYGYSADETAGRQVEDLIVPDPIRETLVESINAWFKKGQEIPSGELQLKRKDGSLVPIYSSHVMLKLQSDEPELFCIDVDLTQQKRAQVELENLASFDRLTHLPNRFLLDTELNQRIEEATRFQQKLAILFIDLDNFKLVNDSMGHACGDILLAKVSRRISSGLRKYDLLARFGGDEFILMMPQVEEGPEIALVADKILREFSKPFDINGRGLYITGSIGISLFPQDGRTAGELIKNADAAMYRAKESGRNRHQFFTQDMNDELRRHQHIANQLWTSLANPDFQLFYQPQVDLHTGEIVSCEALIRWSPIGGEEISPVEFIPVAEKSELISLIGAWVIDEACRQKATWKKQGLAEIRIDINFSGRQFFAKEVCDMLNQTTKRYGLSADEIGIELTEHTLIQADTQVLSRLHRIHDAGVHIAIDDFGTGYSSLGYLKRFPVDSLKIDREFVRDAPTDNSDRSIMKAIVAMGHSLGLQVVVEGIETEEQLRLAHELGCDFAQGFFLHRPMEEKNFRPSYLSNMDREKSWIVR